MAREIVKDGIIANIVVPGRIATKRVEALEQPKASREDSTLDVVEAESVRTIPIRRYGYPEEYSNVVAFIASDCASFINGSILRVGGGMVAII